MGGKGGGAIDVNTHSLHENYLIEVSSHEDSMLYSVNVSSKLLTIEPKLYLDENTKCIAIGKMRIIRRQDK